MQDNAKKVIIGSSKTVEINGDFVTVKKLGLISYTKMQTILDTISTSIAEFLESYQEIKFSSSISDFSTMPQLVSTVSQAILNNIPVLVDFLDICTDMERSYIEQYVGIDDAIILLDAIIEVNKINSIGESVKNLIASLRKKDQ